MNQCLSYSPASRLYSLCSSVKSPSIRAGCWRIYGRDSLLARLYIIVGPAKKISTLISNQDYVYEGQHASLVIYNAGDIGSRIQS